MIDDLNDRFDWEPILKPKPKARSIKTVYLPGDKPARSQVSYGQTDTHAGIEMQRETRLEKWRNKYWKTFTGSLSELRLGDDEEDFFD